MKITGRLQDNRIKSDELRCLRVAFLHVTVRPVKWRQSLTRELG